MSESNAPKAGGLWGRMFGVQADEPEAEQPAKAKEIPLAAPVAPPPVDREHHEAAATLPELELYDEDRVESALVESVTIEIDEVDDAESPTIAVPIASVKLPPCAACGAERVLGRSYCDDCGYMFPDDAPAAAAAVSAAISPDPAPSPRESTMAVQPPPRARLQNRYDVGLQINERLGVRRFRGTDRVTNQPVVIVATAATALALALPDTDDVPMAAVVDDEILPGFDFDVPMAAPTSATIPMQDGGAGAPWPGSAWENGLLAKANHPSLPKVVDQFAEDGHDYLVLEAPRGRSLWDAWDDAADDANQRYTWLQQIAGALHALHQSGAILEGINPDAVLVDDKNQAVIVELADLLPLPLPPDPPIKATLYTAPELILSPLASDARSDMYSFGALLYSLEYLHHALEEKDFERQFTPKQITERFPDVHPLFLRLVNKTFVRDINTRFPTDEAGRTDPTGFQELIKSLDVCRRSFDNVRLDIAAWTTTGIVRTGNEDAFAVLHGVEAYQDDLHEFAMVLLCDGMGGYDAGEVAAALTIKEMRKFLLQQPMFASLSGKEPPTDPVDVKKCQEILRDALKHANREVYSAARIPGKGKRGMGCTAECVYVDNRNVLSGHVGDSRVYHLHQGRLIQLTRDQTLVNRLVELGQLSAAEAENHPRKNELQQAIGGQPDVNPGLYAGKLQRGDWVLVCSDGLSNHISNDELEKMLTREASNSAEEAARRLLNLVNLRGATDNATIVVIRAS